MDTNKPSTTPKGISSIVIGTVYHLPSAMDSLMLDYLYNSLSSIEASFPGCGIILLGDFNKLNGSQLCNFYKLKQAQIFWGGGGVRGVCAPPEMICTPPRGIWHRPQKFLQPRKLYIF